MREVWGEIELGGLLSTSPAGVPSAQANLTYMHQHSHTPVSQLSPCGYICTLKALERAVTYM